MVDNFKEFHYQLNKLIFVDYKAKTPERRKSISVGMSHLKQQLAESLAQTTQDATRVEVEPIPFTILQRYDSIQGFVQDMLAGVRTKKKEFLRAFVQTHHFVRYWHDKKAEVTASTTTSAKVTSSPPRSTSPTSSPTSSSVVPHQQQKQQQQQQPKNSQNDLSASLTDNN